MGSFCWLLPIIYWFWWPHACIFLIHASYSCDELTNYNMWPLQVKKAYLSCISITTFEGIYQKFNLDSKLSHLAAIKINFYHVLWKLSERTSRIIFFFLIEIIQRKSSMSAIKNNFRKWHMNVILARMLPLWNMNMTMASWAAHTPTSCVNACKYKSRMGMVEITG